MKEKTCNVQTISRGPKHRVLQIQIFIMQSWIRTFGRGGFHGIFIELDKLLLLTIRNM